MSIGGWRTSMINSMYSGQPVNLTWSPAANGQLSTVLNYRPNLIGDPMTPEAQRGPNNYLNKHDRGESADDPPVRDGRPQLATSPATYQTDVRLQKDFPLHWEQRRLEFQAECFNLLNKTNFAAPNANRSNSNFGTITSTFAPRIMQFALRFAF